MEKATSGIMFTKSASSVGKVQYPNKSKKLE